MSSDIFDSVFEEQNFGSNIPDGDIFDSINMDANQQSSKQPKKIVNRGQFSFAEGSERPILRALSRVGETALGLPGDIKALGETGADFLLNKVGLPTPQQEPKVNLPTSTGLTNFMNESFKGYLAPQSGREQLADEVVSDATSLFIGNKVPTSGGAVAKTLKTAKPFLVSLGSNLAKELAGKFGASPRVQEAVKLGTMFLGGLANKPSVNNLRENLYKDAKAVLPEGASIESKILEKNLSKLEGRLSKGGTTPSKTPVQTKIDEIKAKIKNGKINVDELQEFKRDINEISSSLYDLPKDVKAKLRSNVNELRSSIKSTINEYGKVNPEFINSWNKAEEVHGAIAQSQTVRDAILKSLRQNPKLSFIGATGLGIKTGGTAVPALAGAGATMLTGEFIAKAMKSPTIRKHYGKVLASALKENTPALTKNLYALNRAVEKEGLEDD